MNPVYYHIIDLNIVGKEAEFVPYLFIKGKGWIVDEEHILSDRLIGYDVETIGSSDIMLRVKEVTEEEANNIIDTM